MIKNPGAGNALSTVTTDATLTGAGTAGSPLGAAPSKMAQIQYQWGIPVGIPSSGSIGNNGALSGLTVIPAFPNCYMFFPANAIAAGVAAGFYLVQMITTSTGTIFNNTLAASGIPTIPAGPTAFVTTGPGAYTQSTSAQTFLTLTIPGGQMGTQGALRYETFYTAVNNANARTGTITLGGTQLQTATGVNAAWFPLRRNIRNAGSQALQYPMSATTGTAISDLATTTASVSSLAINTAIARDWVFVGTIGNAADYMFNLGGTIETLYVA